jgi:hypothetical protein
VLGPEQEVVEGLPDEHRLYVGHGSTVARIVARIICETVLPVEQMIRLEPSMARDGSEEGT